MEQRSEAYRMYVSDSLFFIQHLFSDSTDENRGSMFSMKLREIIEEYESGKTEKKETAEDIKNRMIEKSEKLSGKNL
jgi:hypothetical protein